MFSSLYSIVDASYITESILCYRSAVLPLDRSCYTLVCAPLAHMFAVRCKPSQCAVVLYVRIYVAKTYTSIPLPHTHTYIGTPGGETAERERDSFFLRLMLRSLCIGHSKWEKHTHIRVRERLELGPKLLTSNPSAKLRRILRILLGFSIE